jgi:hypothetical protein
MSLSVEDAERTGADELMITSHASDPAFRLRDLEHVAEAFEQSSRLAARS